jgi:creatinine amidohydrolase
MARRRPGGPFLFRNGLTMTPQYGKLTWEEVRDADKDRVVILNVSATEDHGPHMPLDTDTVLGMAVANGVAEGARTRFS